MSATDSSPASRVVVSYTTVDCYDFWDRVFRRAGVLDYTEGFYQGDRHPLLRAGAAESDPLSVGSSRLPAWLAGPGNRLRERHLAGGGAAARCRGGRSDDFAAAMFNTAGSGGSTFICWTIGTSARTGRAGSMPWSRTVRWSISSNRRMHWKAVRMRSTAGSSRSLTAVSIRIPTRHRLINTTIHFDRVQIEPQDAIRSPWSFPWFSDQFHFAMLARGFGGYYPSLGQLQRCTRPRFKLIDERDATYDCLPDFRRMAAAWQTVTAQPETMGPVSALRDPAPASRGQHAVPALRVPVLELAIPNATDGEPPMKHLWQTWDYQEP